MMRASAYPEARSGHEFPAANPLLRTIQRHKSGEPVGIYSVCSAHPTVVQLPSNKPTRMAPPS